MEQDRRIPLQRLPFQYRKRYKGACNYITAIADCLCLSFNTVNGIRVHAIPENKDYQVGVYKMFQYRKRYKGACNTLIGRGNENKVLDKFQYRKRYKGACNDVIAWCYLPKYRGVSIP